MLNRLFGRKTEKPSEPQKPVPKQPVILDVTDADFADIVEMSEMPVVVDVWAEWCAPCRMMSAYVGFLAQEYEGRLLVTALDADENPATCEKYHVLGLPTLLFIKNGQEIERIVGIVDYPEIKRVTEALLVT